MSRNAFMNALPVIANAIGDSIGVEVVFNAGNPRTDKKRIYLPAVDSDDPKVRKLFLGYVVHEPAHVRFTDFTVKRPTPLIRMISNILEDIRIEKLISDTYPGCKLYLAEMVEGLVEINFFAPLKGDEEPTAVMQQYMLYKLRLDILGQEGITELATQAEAQLVEKVPEGMRIRLDALMYQVLDCKDTQEVVDLSKAIIKMMEEEAKKEEEKQKEAQQQKQQQKQQQQGDADPNPQGQGQSDDKDDNDPKSQSQDPSPSQKQKGDKDDDADASNQAGNGDGDDADNKDDATGQNQSGNGSGGDIDGQKVSNQAGDGDDDDADGHGAAAEVIKQILAAQDGDALKDMGKALEAALGEAQTDCQSSAIPFKNILFDHKAVLQSVDIESEKNRVNAASNALKVRAQSLLQSQTLATKRSVLMGTKLNVKNLHQARLGGPVFQKTREGIKIDTALLVLTDRSPSMNINGRLVKAMDSALATTMAFQRPDVKTAVFSFPYGNGNAVLKTWEQQPASAIPAYATIGTSGTTPMAEAIMGACYALMQRPESRKILMVSTDGDPDDEGKTKWVIDLARKSGIEVLGLGIECDPSKVFGAAWSGVIHDINEMPQTMIGMLDNIMLKKAA